MARIPVKIRGSVLGIALLLLPASSHARTEVSNLSEPLAANFTVDGNFAFASSFTTGASARTLDSVIVIAFTNISGTSELRLRADNAGSPGTVIASLGSQTMPSNMGNTPLTYFAAGTALAANTTYWVTLGETGSGDFQWAATSSTAESSPEAWTIGDQCKYSSNGGASWQDVDFGPANETGMFAIRDTACEASPASGCKTALKSSFSIKNDAMDDSKDQLLWKWGKGQQVDQADLGNPATMATYSLCVYDSTASVDALLAQVAIAPSMLWQDKDPKGWSYKDPDGTQHGVGTVLLKTGVPDKTSAQVKAKGLNLGPVLPAPISGTEYFDQAPRVTVQLVNNQTSACWTSEFTTATKNTSTLFKAKAP